MLYFIYSNISKFSYCGGNYIPFIQTIFIRPTHYSILQLLQQRIENAVGGGYCVSLQLLLRLVVERGAESAVGRGGQQQQVVVGRSTAAHVDVAWILGCGRCFRSESFCGVVVGAATASAATSVHHSGYFSTQRGQPAAQQKKEKRSLVL